jgi:hypothetical protein
MSSICFSQKVISENNDTLVCFDLDQSKFILKEMNRAIYLDSISRISQSEIRLLNTTIKDLEIIVQSQKEQLSLIHI